MSSKQSRPDARLHKDEALAQSKKAAQQNSVLGNATAPMGMHRFDGSPSLETASPALPSGSDRRKIVFPDPVAFRCATLFLVSFWFIGDRHVAKRLYRNTDTLLKTQPSRSSKVEARYVDTNSTLSSNGPVLASRPPLSLLRIPGIQSTL